MKRRVLRERGSSSLWVEPVENGLTAFLESLDGTVVKATALVAIKIHSAITLMLPRKKEGD
jgi:hypothetical protein